MSGLLARSTCTSLTVAVFNSYPTLFIVMFLTVLTSLFGFSTSSLVNIAFGFSLCDVYARLNVSSLTLLFFVMYPSSSSLMNLSTAS